MASRSLWFAVLVTLSGSAPVTAQLCAGLPSFQGRPIQLIGTALFNDNGKAFAGGVGFGGTGAFGNVALGSTHIDVYHASAFNVGGGAGYQVPLDRQGSVQLCPAAEVEFFLGPQNIQGTGVDYSETNISIGVGVGVIAARTEHADVVPTVFLDFANAHSKLKDALGNSTSNSQSFGIVGLGIGFVFSHRVSIRPSAAIPFGISGASTTFGVTLALNYRGAR